MRTARITADPTNIIGAVDRKLFGAFVEHLGRGVYDGLYEPGHPTANGDGFRQDVVELVKELGVTTLRYPGGNFVSGFEWEDSVGPRSERPRRLDLAWHSTETNEVGLHEFAGWSSDVGAELMLALNLGTRGVLDAVRLLEYTNHDSGTALSDSRAANGSPAPLAVNMWCLGNEMDGPWQLGHRSADDYGVLAAQTARAMRSFDPNLTLVVCGSSGRSMPTFGDWERIVLTHTYDEVDYISCHAYYENRDDTASFLASAVDMDLFIESVVATLDHVRAVKKSDKIVNISFDEWNIWYSQRYLAQLAAQPTDDWPVAPRLLEDVYSVLDAVVFGSLIISLLNHADRVTAASLAQLVNVIAPIMTEPSGPGWRQTTFFPFAAASAHARGDAITVSVECDEYRTDQYGSVPVVTAAMTRDPDTSQLAIYLVNRSEKESVRVEIELRSFGSTELISVSTMSDDDPSAANTLEDPSRVTPRHNDSGRLDGGVVFIDLPPISWTELLVR